MKTEDEKRSKVRTTAFWVGAGVLVAAAVLAVVVSTLFFVRRAPGAAVTVRSQGLELSARLQPDPPRPEDQRMLVTLRKDGAPVKDGALAVGYVMPVNSSLPKVSGKATVEKAAEPGRYVVYFPRMTEGTWKLLLSFASPEASIEAGFTMTTGRKGLTVMKP